MNNPDSPPDAKPRATLKLKGTARKVPAEVKAPPAPPQPDTGKRKPGAHWSDEYKERMQADMDALSKR